LPPKKSEASKEKPTSHPTAKLLSKVQLPDNQSQFSSKPIREYSNNTEEESSEQTLDAEPTSTMPFFSSGTEVRAVLSTGSSRTLGELDGEKLDTSDLKATETVLEFAVCKRALMFPPSERSIFKPNIYV